jgi:hypothetical protein
VTELRSDDARCSVMQHAEPVCQATPHHNWGTDPEDFHSTSARKQKCNDLAICCVAALKPTRQLLLSSGRGTVPPAGERGGGSSFRNPGRRVSMNRASSACSKAWGITRLDGWAYSALTDLSRVSLGKTQGSDKERVTVKKDVNETNR